MAKVIASIADGRVVPWFSEEDPVPDGFVVVPPDLHVKFTAGEIADGVSLAKAALAGEPAKPARAKKAAAASAASSLL